MISYNEWKLQSEVFIGEDQNIYDAYDEIKDQFTPQQQQDIWKALWTNQSRWHLWNIKSGKDLLNKLQDWWYRDIIGPRAEAAKADEKGPFAYPRPSIWKPGTHPLKDR